MRTLWQKLTRHTPGDFLAALLLAAGFLAFVTWDQTHWWRVKTDYGFGWLVPLFVGYVVYERWPRIAAAATACAAPGSPRAAGWHRWVLRLSVGLSLLWGVLWFLLGAFYRAGAGASQPGTLAITMGAVAIVLPLLWLHAPPSATPTPAPFWADARLGLVRWFLFPVLVWLVSAPLVSAIENQLSLFLLRKVVTVVFFVFDALGLPIAQEGNVLALPLGRVGMAEACSGIRSLTGCLFAGAFLAAVYLERLGQKLALLSAALGLAFLGNLARSLFLTAWAYRHGPTAIEGAMHDFAGYAILGVTTLGLFALLPLVRRFVPR
ncbi:MAG: exosortase/archaeosortase family protein [Opitutae bacterium]|nr:exosortase/archaeosortase family protein [Opitutae bacterium]